MGKEEKGRKSLCSSAPEPIERSIIILSSQRTDFTTNFTATVLKRRGYLCVCPWLGLKCTVVIQTCMHQGYHNPLHM